MRRAVCLLLAAVGATAASRTATADDKADCVHASDGAQDERAHGHLLAAREQLLACIRPACPGPVREFCEQWLGEVDKATPSVVVRLTDAMGHDLSVARVLVDGRVVALGLDGRPFVVDPGVHVFRFEPQGLAPFEDRLVIVEGEKDRLITETAWLPVQPKVPEPAARLEAPASAPAPTTSSIPTGVFVLGGVGILALGGFAVLALVGQSDYDSCVQRPCSGQAERSLDVVRVLAWSSLGVAVASIGVGGWMFVASRSRGPRVSLGPLHGGGLARVEVGF